MADPLEQSALTTRDFSPITEPRRSAEAGLVGEEVTIAGPEAERSMSASNKQEDDEKSNLSFVSECFVSPSPVDYTNAANTTGDRTGDVSDDTTEDVTGDVTGDVSGDRTEDLTGDVISPNIQTRCVGNFLNPRPGECDSKITNDDRHYISNFFGRNKSCSTSIPDEFYQVLCRKCMQAQKYRLRGKEGVTEVKVQVAAIKHALKNMATSGKWLFFEVQFTKAEYDRRQDPEKYDADIKKFNDAIIKSREESKQKGGKFRRRNTKKPLVPVPDWLADIVVQNDDQDVSQKYVPVHGRRPARWSFERLLEVVDMIGEGCTVLPNIECLPITQGELDKTGLLQAHTLRKCAKEELQRLVRDVENAEKQLREDPQSKQRQEDLETFLSAKAAMEKALEDAETEVQEWTERQAASAHTLPPKRFHVNKPSTKGESSKTKAKKAKTTMTEDQASQNPLTDSVVQDETRAETPSTDVQMADSKARSRSPSPSPPPGWKGKGRVKAYSVSDPESLPRREKGKRESQAKPREPSASIPAAPANSPATPSPQTKKEAEDDSTVLVTTTSPPRDEPAAIPNPATPPPQPSTTNTTAAAPVTPTNQITTSFSPRRSTTRSAGRRFMLERGESVPLAPAPAQAYMQTQGVKRKMEDEDEDEKGDGNGEEEGEVTEKGSPVRKKARRSGVGNAGGSKD